MLTDYDVHEVHSLWVPAASADAYAAVKAVPAREVRLFGPLMRLRTFGRSSPLIEEMLTVGFVQLGERPGEEVVVGAIGCFWSPT